MFFRNTLLHMYTFTDGQSAHKLINKLADIMKIIQVSPESKVYPILSWTFMNLYRQLYRARCQFEIFYDVHSKIVSYPNTGFIGFLIATLQGFHIHLCLWMNGWKATIGINGFWSGKPLVAMVFQWFWSGQPLVPMVFQWFCSPATIGPDGFSMVSKSS